MKISNKLEQFKDQSTLIVVCGKQEALIYKAIDGIIEKLDQFKVPSPHYSDNEGHFESRINGSVIRAGSPREIDDSDIIKEFSQELVKHLKMHSHEKWDQVYIFTPLHLKNYYRNILPHKIEKNLTGVIVGNYFKNHPFDLILKIMQFEEKNNSTEDGNGEEVSKILHTYDVAHYSQRKF